MLPGLIVAGMNRNGEFVTSWARDVSRAQEEAGRLGLVNWGMREEPSAREKLGPWCSKARPYQGEACTGRPLPPIVLPSRDKYAH